MDGRLVALKQIDMEQSLDELQACQREILIMLQLNHPNVTRCFNSYVEDHYLYISMELGDCTLGDIMKQSKMSDSEIASVISQLLTGVCYLHSQNVIHRDLKPQNVLLCMNDLKPVVKICDFGIATAVKTLVKNASVLGTAGYAAPEQIMGQLCSYPTDIWSIGVIIALMAGCRVETNLATVITCTRERRNYLEAEIQQKITNPDLLSLTQSMLQLDPSARGTAEQLLKHKFLGCKNDEKLAASVARCSKHLALSRGLLSDSHVAIKESHSVSWDFEDQKAERLEDVELSGDWEAELDEETRAALKKLRELV